MELRLSSFGAAGDGITNDASALRACFSTALQETQAVIIVEPGSYLIDTDDPIPLGSHLSVRAEGATFLFPKDLGSNTIRRMFCGTDVEDFTWTGGHFVGYVYDIDQEKNIWQPDTYAGCIQICSSKLGFVQNIRISNVSASNVAGAVINICGQKAKLAERIDIRDCYFVKCGKFMWDYGYLWQRIVFAHEYDPQSVNNARKYIPAEHMSSELRLENGKLFADYMPKALPQEIDQITFFGKHVPKGTKRGKQYYVLNKAADNGLILSETENGPPVTFDEIAHGTHLFRNMFYIFHDLYEPVGNSTDEKGSITVEMCHDVIITGCRLNAVGDSMLINRSQNVVFSNNQITGSRMGAFFIGFYCKNVVVSGNTVNGTNGSRTMSIEEGTEDITITGNTFIGGGRGNWFNTNRNVIISDNIFIENTQKCCCDMQKGRICQATGDFERYPELYFTGYQYGPVIIRGNLFKVEANALAAIAFNPGGHDILLDGNILQGDMRDIHVASGCDIPIMVNNIGIGAIKENTFVNTANERT